MSIYKIDVWPLPHKYFFSEESFSYPEASVKSVGLRCNGYIPVVTLYCVHYSETNTSNSASEIRNGCKITRRSQPKSGYWLCREVVIAFDVESIVDMDV